MALYGKCAIVLVITFILPLAEAENNQFEKNSR
jgi:hypothetical protein